jgi:hypothetical protein
MCKTKVIAGVLIMIASEVYYQFDGSPKSPTRYETLTLIVEPDTPPQLPNPKRGSSWCRALG